MADEARAEGVAMKPLDMALNTDLWLTDANGTLYRIKHAAAWDPPDDPDAELRAYVYYEDEERPVGAFPLYRIEVEK